jgi:hypothetical protein
MPTRDSETGNITDAGYIPIIQSYTKNIIYIVLAFHGIQNTVRIVMNHETMIIPMWFPFDASWSPLYEIINAIQVMIALLRYLITNMLDICTVGYISDIPNLLVPNVYHITNSRISLPFYFLCNIMVL